ncbi:DUF2911 domain-containing protein [Mucilaginibacter ginsenosidivorans]|uniref:DUF2911 domain-containing protein n=1 Tax=Mucilaginibacter ginsenosidivorans TaxID=398053 RepID=A0A5B8UXX3_9SPHI|nr:DUF2911 domain-containing protein [Mucilaginibacter ginsenosidivorans]QEC63236.1 DUF2911 domain-containing protein [Mucilaginibacter ginsenosidivorans]
MRKLTLLFAVVFMTSTAVFAQKKPIASPRDSVSGTIAGATVKIAFGSPAVKGRKIGGEIAPYGKIWRTGANEMTTFETSKALKIGGKTLPAGKYSLFSVPGETEWKFIFNSVTGKWGIKMDGSANDDASKDVLTVMAKAMKSPTMNERMTFKITPKGFTFLWGNVEVPVAVQ